MTLRFTRWRGPTGRALPLALAFALIALPVAASETATTAPAKATAASPANPASTTSLRQAAARAAVTAAPARTEAVRRAEQSDTSRQSSGFFKSRPGMIALAVMVVGTGYALYSVKHDRITSPAKK